MHAYNSQEMEAGRTGVHHHSQLHSERKATLSYMKPWLSIFFWTKAASLKGDSGIYLREKSHQIQENSVFFSFS